MALPLTHTLEEGAHPLEEGTAALVNELAALEDGTETIYKNNYILHNCYIFRIFI